MTIELLNIDCMEYMAGLEDDAFDLAIVDPPYGTGRDVLRNARTRSKLAKAGAHKLFDNTNPPPPEYFKELMRISKNQVIWGANHFCDRFNASGSKWLVWEKHTTGSFADCELAYTSFPGALRRFDYTWNGMIQGSHGIKRNNEIKIHPTQKPIALYAWVLALFANPGHRVIDTHLGSGSSAVAAYRHDCEFVGCEIDLDYHVAALKRFDAETAQMAMEL